MTNEFGEVNQGGTGTELVGDEGVAKVVDLGTFDFTQAEVTVNAGADVSD